MRRLVDVQGSHVRVELRRVASSAADTFACDHAYSSHNGVGHRILLTSNFIKVLIAAISSNGNDFDGLSGRSFDDDTSHASAAAFCLCFSSDFLGHFHETRYVVVRQNLLLGAADDARMRAEGVGLAVDGWPVLLRPLLGLLGTGRRQQGKGDLSEDKRKAIVDERRVGKKEFGKSVFADAADGTNDQVQRGRDTTPTFVAR